MRVLKGLLFGLTCLVMLPASAYAQASITGVVKDSSGGVLPGVTVEASSPALIEKVRNAVTDESGIYRIVDLRPGTYTVEFSLPGFSTVKREGIELTGSFAASVNAEMRVGALAETITVTGESPVVDIQNTVRETTISKDIIAAIPATRAYGSLLNATPGITVDTNGLATTPTMTFFSAHGGKSNEGRMTINGMVVAAAFNGGGVSSLTYNTTDAEEVTTTVAGGLGESEIGGPAMNIVPRSGGNNFAGQAFYNTAGKWSTGDNLTDTLRSQGITTNAGIINAWDASGNYGGPIKKDKVWFFGSFRDYSTTTPAGSNVKLNLNAGNPLRFDYLPDNSGAVEPRNIMGRKIWAARGTAQVTSKNRVTFSQEQQYRCEGSTLTTGSSSGCRQRASDWIGLGSNTQSPEASTAYIDLPYWVTQATWSNPLTNKLLLEAGYSRFAYNTNGGPGIVPPDGIFDQIPVTEQAARDGHIANYIYRAVGTYNNNYDNPNAWRASASYVTGSHNMKIGYQGGYSINNTLVQTNPTLLAYQFNNGVANRFTYRLPDWHESDRTAMEAVFLQDSWTHNRLSLQGAIRYDHASSFSPAEGNGTTEISRFNAAPITLPRTAGVDAYQDISPRMGAAYDVFGNGKTALKFNIGRYLSPATNDTNYTLNSPANRIIQTVARNWTDTNKNNIVDCDILNPAGQNTGLPGSIVIAGNDVCGALTGDQLNFGKSSATTTVNPALLKGWGVRPADWQWGVDLQQELMPRVSLDVQYNRRWFKNFYVTDNLAVSPSDYQKWTITAPLDSRLPGGGGYPVDVYTLTAAAAARPAQNYITPETDYGPARTNYWQGVDVTVNARTRQGLTLQGGTTTGRAITDTCATVIFIDSPDPRNCRSVDPIETTFRGLASYTVPKIGILVSGTVRSQPALQIIGTTNPTNTGGAPNGATPAGAYMNVPNSVVQSLLGRLPPGGTATGTTVVALLDANNRLYAGNRRNQIDMRFAKVFRFSGRRADIGVDLNNLLNTNYTTAYETQYAYGVVNGGTWNNPTTILAPRFVRLNFTLNF
jgi:hypothetical protein